MTRHTTALFAFVISWSQGSVGDAPSAVCATVKLQLSQDIVLTRTAFAATLVIDNGTTSLLDHVDVDLDIRTLDGLPANHLFGIPAPTVTGISDADGLGFVLPGDAATIKWEILAKDEATANGEAVTYTFGGSILSDLDGVPDTVSLYPQALTVYPDASLELDYFLQTEVFADNPFTPEVLEPIEPFSLGMIVRNNGQGAAQSLSTSQKQPVFLENSKGLALSVKVVASELSGQPLSPSLDVDLGELAPGASKTVRWLLTSNITGTLSNLSVSWTHEKGTGEDGLSLIESAEVHATTHLVDAARKNIDLDFDDLSPDFLVDDPSITAPLDPITGVESEAFPDTIYASTGQVEPIAAVISPTVVETPSAIDLSIPIDVTITATGWHYLRIEDPGSGAFELVQVARTGTSTPRTSFSVGGPGDVCEAWITSRPISTGGDPAPEFVRHQLHILDWFDQLGTYRYDVLYQTIPLEKLTTNKDSISVSAGGTLALNLNAGPEYAHDFYVVVGSASGTIPGTIIGESVLPLNNDTYLQLLLTSKRIQNAWHLHGVLSDQGTSTGPGAPTIVISPSVHAAGTLLHHVYFVLDRNTREVVLVSNAAPLYLVP